MPLHINLIRKRTPHQYSVLTLNSISPTHTGIPFLKSLIPSNIFEKISYFNSIFLQTGETPNKHGNSYTITQNSDTITETPDFCVIVQSCPYRHPISGIQKHEKAGPTNHRDEPHQALTPLILSHSSILLPASTQNPMALFFYCRLCRC